MNKKKEKKVNRKISRITNKMVHEHKRTTGSYNINFKNGMLVDIRDMVA